MSVRRSVAALLAGAALLASTPAAAYVRTRTAETNAALFWASPQTMLEVTRPPDSFSVAPDDLRAAAEGAISTWSYPALDCTTVSLTLTPGFADSEVVAFDGHNRIITRTGAWCRDPDALTGCHDPAQVALTTVFSRNRPGELDDGQILEADIELNDVSYEWAVIPDGEFSGRDYANAYDLRGALTHEVGHFIGLAHDCLLPGDVTRLDDAGHVSPECAATPGNEPVEISGATMYAVMSPADVSWRSLSDDDARGACSLYSRDYGPVLGWCAVASSPSGATSSMAGLGLFGAIAVVSLVRRSRAAPRQPRGRR